VPVPGATTASSCNCPTTGPTNVGAPPSVREGRSWGSLFFSGCPTCRLALSREGLCMWDLGSSAARSAAPAPSSHQTLQANARKSMLLPISSFQTVQHRTVQYGKIQYALSSYPFSLQSLARFVPKNTGVGGVPPLSWNAFQEPCFCLGGRSFSSDI
jgi:hypothetical protein